VSQTSIRLRSLVKRFGQVTAVDGIDLDVPGGAFVTLLGPSGCGKTTLLRLIGGFELPDSGDVLIDGEEMGDRPPHLRGTTTVFQNYALFPHMSIAENVAFGLRERKMPKTEMRKRVADMLDLIGLPHVADRRANELSGGQQQRVALARALVVSPTVLLLDEPLGALDLQLRRQMQVELKRIQRQVGITFIHVTHDQEEALSLSDRIIVMNGGRIEQDGTPDDVFARPLTPFVARFMGARNILGARVVQRDGTSSRLRIGREDLSVPTTFPGREATVVVRPEKVSLGVNEGWSGVVKETLYKGSVMSYVVTLEDGLEIEADVAHEQDARRFAVGDRVGVSFRPEDAVILPAPT